MISLNETIARPTSVLQDYSFIITTKRPANFIELNPFKNMLQASNEKNSDVDALKEVKYRFGNWGHNASLISDIFEYESTSTNNVNSRYFALTRQEDSFEKLKPSEILGIAKTTQEDRNNVFIDMIQVNPWYAFTSPKDAFYHPSKPQYRHCGTAIIDSLKEIFKNKDLWLHSPVDLIDYFKTHGFEIADLPANKGDALMRFSKKLQTGVIK